MGNVTIRPTQRDAFELFHQGNLALGAAEYSGIRIDRPYCERMIANQDRLSKRLTEKFAESELGKLWRKRYKNSTNFDSDDQLRTILFTDLKLEPVKMTAGGKKEKNKQPAVDAASLEKLDRDDLKILLQKSRVDKNSGTYLKNLLLESASDGYCHPFFNLSIYSDDQEGGARSFRSSSSSPNFQNQPNRREEDRKLIRRAFLPRPGRRIVGRDYSGIEVMMAACVNQDANLMRYIEQGDDMHRDCASMCYLLPPEMCSKRAGKHGKAIRQAGKNQFVFPQFYFQEPNNSAAGLWRYMISMDLRHPADPEKTIQEHLKEKGIKTYEAFEKHIIGVCDNFWTSLFPAYGKWRNRHIDQYNKRGYFDMLTGFRVEGVLSRYQLGNYPIQGPAFHCLLWSFIQTHQLWKTTGKESLVIGQIHDEMTTDEPEAEFWENQKVIPRIMTQDIRKHWDFLVVKMEIETEATPVDQPWYYKTVVKEEG